MKITENQQAMIKRLRESRTWSIRFGGRGKVHEINTMRALERKGLITVNDYGYAKLTPNA